MSLKAAKTGSKGDADRDKKRIRVKYIFEGEKSEATEQNPFNNADKKKCFKVYTSFGVCNQVLPFLTVLERIQCQALN